MWRLSERGPERPDEVSLGHAGDAGEYGRTRYRLAPNVRFALVEPLFGSNAT